jgi:hypothetical protein
MNKRTRWWNRTVTFTVAELIVLWVLFLVTFGVTFSMLDRHWS